jgi:hypothetical protein
MTPTALTLKHSLHCCPAKPCMILHAASQRLYSSYLYHPAVCSILKDLLSASQNPFQAPMYHILSSQFPSLSYCLRSSSYCLSHFLNSFLQDFFLTMLEKVSVRSLMRSCIFPSCICHCVINSSSTFGVIDAEFIRLS